ncbi:TIR domain-containing protein [Nitrosarchaeum sp. AC2]|uniref:TIR domain-containing protein n=1 Tax=Nitrosarchaeum sp. AC2 TaxID=2259673 RepID=UPI0015C89FDB|nr:TIR domain-containing protein [Nitrosarchaeum sp. AC2]QLH10267.1 molecular chaperone Tir [Nitrosarchaeum sp. AC2]
MGASGGGFNYQPNQTSSDSQRKYQSATDEAKRFEAGTGKRNVFVSFHMEDEAQVRLLTHQATSGNFGLEFRDYSVKEPFDEKWRANVRERISQTSVTIVMIGPDTASRPAVNFEIEESYRQGKKVIGVKIYKDRNDPIPNAMVKHKAPIVNWVLSDIQKELDES